MTSVLQAGCLSPSQVAPHSPVGLPMTIVTPLLTPECVQLLSEEVAPEEDQLWQSLGDPWNVPRWESTSDPLDFLRFI